MTKNWVHCWTPSKKAEPTLKYFPNGSLHPPFWWILWPSRPLKSFFEEKILRMTIQSFLDSSEKYSNFQKKWYFGGQKVLIFCIFRNFFKKCKKPKIGLFCIFSKILDFQKNIFLSEKSSIFPYVLPLKKFRPKFFSIFFDPFKVLNKKLDLIFSLFFLWKIFIFLAKFFFSKKPFFPMFSL